MTSIESSFSIYKKVGCVLCMLLFFLTISRPSQAQVSEVAKLAQINKDGGGDVVAGVAAIFFIEFFEEFVWFLGRGQGEVLRRREEEPWLVSLEGGLHAGYYGKETATLALPSFKANWGLFSTHVRWNRMQDFTGSFRTFDWQIFQLYFVNKPTVGFRAGLGISREIDIDQTFSEYTLGLELHFNDRKVNPMFEYRASRDYDTGQTPRREFNTRLDYKVASSGKFNIHLSGGLLYQQYYSRVNFYFLQTGIYLTFY